MSDLRGQPSKTPAETRAEMWQAARVAGIRLRLEAHEAGVWRYDRHALVQDVRFLLDRHAAPHIARALGTDQ